MIKRNVAARSISAPPPVGALKDHLATDGPFLIPDRAELRREYPELEDDDIRQALLANDFTGMEQLFGTIFAGIPNDWYRSNPIARHEGYYASVCYAYFASLGLHITPEVDALRLSAPVVIRTWAPLY